MVCAAILVIALISCCVYSKYRKGYNNATINSEFSSERVATIPDIEEEEEDTPPGTPARGRKSGSAKVPKSNPVEAVNLEDLMNTSEERGSRSVLHN